MRLLQSIVRVIKHYKVLKHIVNILTRGILSYLDIYEMYGNISREKIFLRYKI